MTAMWSDGLYRLSSVVRVRDEKRDNAIVSL